MNDSLVVKSINGIPFGDFILKSFDVANLTLTGKTHNSDKHRYYISPFFFLGRKTFEDETTVNTLVTKLVNGHEIKDIITLDTDQEISTPVNFRKGFEVAGDDLTVEKINNIAWKRVREIGLHPAILEQETLVKDVIIQNSCAIKGILESSEVKVGNENLKGVLDDLVYKV